MYKEIEPIPNLPELENSILSFWEKEDIMLQLKKLRKGSKEKVYYDGPITTNNVPHYGHAITWTMKDVIPRYWGMRGYFVERNMGWDTKGILVEYEVEKELKFVNKDDIKKFGEAKFIKYCRDFVNKYKEIMYKYELRLGRWMDPDVTYSTDDSSFVESEWWSLKKLYEMGLLYEGYKTVAYSTRAGMTLSTHEVSEGGYKEVEDPFVTVKFKLKGEKDAYFLAWTTTPWTIPGNLMLAVNGKLTYVKVTSDGESFIVVKTRLKELFKGKKYKVVESISGSKLIGKEYEQPFKNFEKKRSEGCFRVVSSSHAKSDEGTGIVHLAPYGEEDYEIFMSLGIPLFDYLDETANFNDLVPPYKGLFYKDANQKIIEDLKGLKVLFDTGTILHRMPICYRTGTPLIFKPVRSWYIGVSKLKSKMLKENNKINWLPAHLKDGISGTWIKNARDWAISRTRYWGTPFPLWVNDKTQEKVFIGSFADLEQKSGKKVIDPHRPSIDEFSWEDRKNGGTFYRVKDVIDVWYDSGSMPFANLHYPFENQKRFFELMPADYISEGPDQVHLWFYVMHVLGVGLFGKAPYRNVVTIGNMLDESGKKMSKSKKNYKPMDDTLAEYGADVLRYFVLTSSLVNGEDAIFGDSVLRSARKDFFLPLWNSLKYYITYANLYGFKPGSPKVLSKNVLDKWVLTRLMVLEDEICKNMDSYRIFNAAKAFSPFVSDLSTWYIRRSRERFASGEKQALGTLHEVLKKLSILLAPFLPFLSEEIYRSLNLENTTGLMSVHLNVYPGLKKITSTERKLLSDMEYVKTIVEKGHSERKNHNIKLRRPLAGVVVTSSTGGVGTELTEVIKDELNVKSVKFISTTVEELTVKLDTKISLELELEGLARDLIRKIQEKRKEAKTNVADIVSVEYERSEQLDHAVEKFGEVIKVKAKVKTLIPGEVLKIL